MQASGRFPDIDAVTRFCQLYIEQPDDALNQLGTTAQQLSKPQGNTT